METALPSAIVPDVDLSVCNTFGVGGTGHGLAEISSVEELAECTEWAVRHGLPILYLGSGSNLLFSDEGFRGLLLRSNMRSIEWHENEVAVAGGAVLGRLVREANARGLAGLECLSGIPGTVAGAVAGNAGANGQEIGAVVLSVDVWSQGSVKRLPAAALNFGYRRSQLKQKRNGFLLGCRLRLRETTDDLQAVSRGIAEQRRATYPPGMKCAGSFFKNIPVESVNGTALDLAPPDCIHNGLIPAGKLLDVVGAKGERCGDARVSERHANVLVNTGRASSAQILALARRMSIRVLETFGIQLEPEVQIVGPEGLADFYAEECQTPAHPGRLSGVQQRDGPDSQLAPLRGHRCRNVS